MFFERHYFMKGSNPEGESEDSATNPFSQMKNELHICDWIKRCSFHERKGIPAIKFGIFGPKKCHVDMRLVRRGRMTANDELYVFKNAF